MSGLMAVAMALVVLLGTIACALIAQDIWVLLPHLAETIVRRAVSRLPRAQQDRAREEFLAHLDRQPMHLWKLCIALEHRRAVRQLIGEQTIQLPSPPRSLISALSVLCLAFVVVRSLFGTMARIEPSTAALESAQVPTVEIEPSTRSNVPASSTSVDPSSVISPSILPPAAIVQRYTGLSEPQNTLGSVMNGIVQPYAGAGNLLDTSWTKPSTIGLGAITGYPSAKLFDATWSTPGIQFSSPVTGLVQKQYESLTNHVLWAAPDLGSSMTGIIQPTDLAKPLNAFWTMPSASQDLTVRMAGLVQPPAGSTMPLDTLGITSSSSVYDSLGQSGSQLAGHYLGVYGQR